MKEENQKSLYVPELEHDSCGTGFIAHLKGDKSHRIVEDAITMLENMEHRGACGCDAESGDGAGILIQMPHLFFKEECHNLGIDLPEPGAYGVGMVFFSTDYNVREKCRRLLNKYIKELGFVLLGYREVPVNNAGVGPSALVGEPKIEQVFVKPAQALADTAALERKLYLLRNYTSHLITKAVSSDDRFYIASFSHKVIIYKGQLRTNQLRPYFPDLNDSRVISALALIHSRFSTNTFPKWKLAQPFRYIAHNGEINTIRGNINWMKSKEAILHSSLFTDEEIQMLLPICNAADSDSANLDNLVELLTLGGRSLPQVMMMLIPEAWQEDKLMDEDKKAFYEYHAFYDGTLGWPGCCLFH
jgi:glutamate synthase (NADPH/NADH) large chain